MFGCVTSGLNRGSSYCSSIHSCALCTELAVKTRLWPGECSASFATVLFDPTVRPSLSSGDMCRAPQCGQSSAQVALQSSCQIVPLSLHL